jgi:hypothetical protein
LGPQARSNLPALDSLPLREIHSKTLSAALQSSSLEPLALLKALACLKALRAAKTALEALQRATGPSSPGLGTGGEWTRVLCSGKIDADNNVVRMQRRRCGKEHQNCKHPAFHARSLRD